MIHLTKFLCVRQATITFAIIVWLTCVPYIMMSCYLATNQKITLFQGFLSEDSNPRVPTANSLFLLGSIVIFIGFCGVFGSVKNNRFMMCLYLICLFMVVMVQASFCVYYAMSRDSNESSLNYSLVKRLHVDYPPESAPLSDVPDFKQQIDTLQFTLGKCCGAFGPQDWRLSNWRSENKQLGLHYFVPRSCCDSSKYPNAINRDKKGTQSYIECLSKHDYHHIGCVEDAHKWLTVNFAMVVGIAYLFIFIELISMNLTAAFIVQMGDLDPHSVVKL